MGQTQQQEAGDVVQVLAVPQPAFMVPNNSSDTSVLLFSW